MSRNYISKEDLYNEFVVYTEACREASEQGLERPQPQRAIAEAILLIANNIARKANFSQYTWIDEMKGDAILQCIERCHKFDVNRPERNPFWYLSRICENAFIERLKQEKKQSRVKYSLVVNCLDDEFFDIQDDDEGEYRVGIVEFMRQHQPAAEAMAADDERRRVKARKAKSNVDPMGGFFE
jgi:DNA-directed RNA polymerase specialized sigma24 family protein